MPLVPLSSTEGKKRLEDAKAACALLASSGCGTTASSYHQVLCSTSTSTATASASASASVVQTEMVEAFRKQRGNTVCGLASLAMILTAAAAAASASGGGGDGDGDGDDAVEDANARTHAHAHHYYVDEDDVHPMAVAAAAGNFNSNSNTTSSPNANTSTSSISSTSTIISDDITAIVSDEKIRSSGMTLDQVTALAAALPTTQKAVALFPVASTAASCGELDGKVDDNDHDDDDDGGEASALKSATTTSLPLPLLLTGPDALREIAIRVLSKPSSREALILNYHMSTLGQGVSFGGHLSPIAAYHAASDSLLVMDVWHTNTEPVWASIVDVVKEEEGDDSNDNNNDNDNDDGSIWKAISRDIDSESQKPRGLLHVTHHPV